MVAGPERDAHERNVTLERHLRDSRERAVPAGDAEHNCLRRARNLAGILALAKLMCLQLELLCLGEELVRAGVSVPGAGVHDQKGVQGSEVWDSPSLE